MQAFVQEILGLSEDNENNTIDIDIELFPLKL